MMSGGGRRRKCEVLNLGGFNEANLSPLWAHQALWLSERPARSGRKATEYTRQVNQSMNNDSMKQIDGSVATKLPLASLNKHSALSRGPHAKNRQKLALYSTPSMGK